MHGILDIVDNKLTSDSGEEYVPYNCDSMTSTGKL